VEDIARQNHTDYEGGRKIVMDSLGGIPIGRPASRGRLLISSRSLPRHGLLRITGTDM